MVNVRDEQTGPRRWPIALVIAALIGLAVWWLRAPAVTVTTDDATPVEGAVAVDPRVGPRDRPLPAIDLRRGERAAVSGLVKDDQGRPLAGAQVCARAISEQLASSDTRRATCVTSEADGRYRIGDLYGVRHSLLASAPGHVGGSYTRGEGARRRETISLRPGQEARDIDITLAGGGVEVRGFVKDLSGGPVEGAQLLAERSLAFTNADGGFSLWVRPGEARVYASADGYTDGFSEGAAPGHLFELFLTPESVLIGKVIRAGDGSPIEGARVTAKGGGDNWTDAVAFTDVAGNFRLDGLEPGPYKASAEADDAAGIAAEQAMLGLGETSEPIVITAHPAFFIEATMTVSGGDVCDQGTVELQDRSAGTRHRMEPEGDGVVRARGLLPGDYAVQLACEGYVAAPSYPNVKLVDRSIRGLTWQLTRGQQIRGVVVDAGGKPVSHLHVGADPVAEPGQPRGPGTAFCQDDTDADGRFTITGLLAGAYQLSVSAESPPRAVPGTPTDVRLTEGEDLDGIRIELPATGEVRGRVVDENNRPIVRASIALIGDERQYGQAADDGSFTFAAVAPGTYRVKAYHEGRTLRAPGRGDDDVQGEPVEVRVGSTEDVKLIVADASGTLTGVVRDADGAPIADAFIDAARESDSAGASGGGALRDSRWRSYYGPPHMTDLDGRFTLTDLASGTYTVRANRRGGGEGVVEHAAFGADVTITIADAGRMSGTVVLAGGGTPESFSIDVTDAATGFRRSDHFSRTAGAWSLAELPDGNYKVQVDASGGVATAEAAMKGGADTTGVRIELSPKVTLRGMVVDLEGKPVPGMRVDFTANGTFQHDDGPDKRNITDVEGRYEVSQAPTGAVRVAVMPRDIIHPDWGIVAIDMRITASGPVVELPPIRLSKQRVKDGMQAGDLGYSLKQAEPGSDPITRPQVVAFVRPGGPAATAGLKPGDEIVRCDGQDVTGTSTHLLQVLTRVTAGTVVTLGLASGADLKITAGKAP